jgi:hypothetical protein
MMRMRKKRLFAPKESIEYRYSESVAEAVRWLGDRYLLARPIRNHCSGQSKVSCGDPHLIEEHSEWQNGGQSCPHVRQT